MSQTTENNNNVIQTSEDLLQDQGIIGPGIPYSLGDMIKYSQKGGNPMGFESMTKDGRVPLTWARGAPKHLEPAHFQCLVKYYGRQYSTPIVVINNVKKFKKIDVLGSTYSSRLTGSNVGIDFNAFRQDDFENDDLEGVNITDTTEHLRAGSVDYFFCHQAQFTDTNGKTCYLNHYFAFVHWFKNPRTGKEDLS